MSLSCSRGCDNREQVSCLSGFFGDWRSRLSHKTYDNELSVG